jgi:hypothetical protein
MTDNQMERLPVCLVRIVDVLERLAGASELSVPEAPAAGLKPKFDRTAYQRELMRKRRAAVKAADG